MFIAIITVQRPMKDFESDEGGMYYAFLASDKDEMQAEW